MSFVSKPLNTLKRWGSGSGYGFRRSSHLNPLTHGFWTAKKLYNGIKRGKWMANVGKLVGMSRHANAYGANSAASYSVYGPTGSIVGRY